MQKVPCLLYETSTQKLYDTDFINAFQEVGIKEGDKLLVHSDLSVFGKLALFDRSGLCQALVESLKASVGDTGTLIMPTFTYSFCKNTIYDVEKSSSTVGVLTEFFRKQPNTLRTFHPIFSAAISGKHKEVFHQIDMDSFGKNSIFGKLHQHKGKLLFLGTSLAACTFIHYVEQMHGVSYRFMKSFHGIIKEGTKEYQAEATYLVRYLDRNVLLDLSRFEQHLLKSGLMYETHLGHGRILAIEADTLLKEGCKMLDQDHYFFLKEKPLEIFL